MIVAALACVAVALCAVLLGRARADRAARTRAQRTAADAVEGRYTLLEAVPDGVYTLDEMLRVTHVNEEAERLLHAEAGALVGRELATILDPLGSDLVPEIRRAQATGDAVSRLAYFGATGWWIEIRITPAAKQTVVYLRDVTTQKSAEALRAESERRLRLLMGQVPAVLWSVNRLGQFVSISGAGLGALGMRPDELIGTSCTAFLGVTEAPQKLDAVFAGMSLECESVVGVRCLRHLVEPLRSAAGEVIGAVGASVDVTELQRSREHLEVVARRDVLTSLPNRFALEETLAAALGDRSAEGECAVLFIDLDRFKAINDTFGHRTGDEVLRIVADRLCSSLDAADVVARQGGDEFIVVLRSVRNPDDVGMIASRLLRRLHEPIKLGGRQHSVTGSIGAALAPQHGTTPEELIKNADAAMFRAKSCGAGRFMFFDNYLEADLRRRAGLERELVGAGERGELRLLYQPIVDARSHRIVGCEALVRWDHPEHGLLEPGAFIGIAEEAGVLGEVTRWVLGEACRFGAAARATAPQFRVSVNLADSDVREAGIVETVGAELHAQRLEPAGLEIDVSESALHDDAAIVSLNALRVLGVRLAVDDFGAAGHSLTRLKRLPVNTLKIDRIFVREVAHDAHDRAIVNAIGTMGRSLGLTVLAEGVEDETQAAFVRDADCHEAQGYWFGHPVSAYEIERFLARSD
jgi:diguanylate cyclase (GGDEF)-like protein/PAS domain S-box-containing protein